MNEKLCFKAGDMFWIVEYGFHLFVEGCECVWMYKCCITIQGEVVSVSSVCCSGGLWEKGEVLGSIFFV